MWEIAVHLAVARGVYDGVFLCCPFLFPTRCRGWELGLESVSEGFPTYFWLDMTHFFNSGLDYIKINFLTKFHEDWLKTVSSRVYT